MPSRILTRAEMGLPSVPKTVAGMCVDPTHSPACWGPTSMRELGLTPDCRFCWNCKLKGELRIREYGAEIYEEEERLS